MCKKKITDMCTKTLLLLIYNTILIGSSLAQNSGNCTIPGIVDVQWLSAVILYSRDDLIDGSIISQQNYSGTLSISEYKAHAVPSLTDLTQNFNVTSDDANFYIKATAEMANFDEYIPKQTGIQAQVDMTVKLLCEGGISTLPITLNVKDINTHEPTFSEKEYVFKVASPLMPPTDFSVYGSSVIVTDLDFSNQDVTFTIDPDDFEILTSKTDTEKNYTAIFHAKKVIQINEPLTYTITATDSGTVPGSLSSNATIILTADESISLDNPSFTRSSYSFNYSINEDGAILTALNGPITVNTNKLDLATIQLTGDMKNHFNYSLNKINSTVEFLPMDSFTPDSSVTVLTLALQTDGSAVAAIIIYSQETIINFSSHVYTGYYDINTNTVTLNDSIVITSSGVPEVTLTGDYMDSFNITLDDSKEHYHIEVIKHLSNADLKKNPPVKLLITATVDDQFDTANLLIYSNAKQLEFDRVLYSANYSSDGPTVIVNDPIGFSSEVNDVNITVDDSYADNFLISYDSTAKKYIVTVNSPPSEDILQSQTEIVLTITAKDIYDNNAQSVLKIELPKGPKFEKAYYLANYSTTEDIVDFENELVFENVENQSNIVIELDSYQENFVIEYEEKWRIKIIRVLNESVLQSNTELTLTMKAKETGKTSEGVSVLILQLPTIPKNTPPEFTNAFYTAQYPESGEGIVDFDTNVTITNIDDPAAVTIILSDYGDNFEVQYVFDKWQLNITKPLDSSILKTHRELIMTLIANTSNTDTEVATSVLVVKLPDAPEFSESYYIAEYKISEETASVVLEHPISITNRVDFKSISINVNNYTDNFNVTYDDEIKQWNIIPIKYLDEEILNSNTELVMILLATDAIGTRQSTLILKLPTQEAPEFSSIHYIADYNTESLDVTIDTPITISNKDDLSKINITFDESYRPYFSLSYNTKTSVWDLNLTSFPKNINSSLVLTLTAKEFNNNHFGQATLIFNMPLNNTNLPPKFSKAYYSAVYAINEENGEITMSEPIEIINKDAGKVNITLDSYESNFDILLDKTKKQWNLNVIKPLPDKVLNNNTELVLTIQATEENNDNTGESTLIIKLPSNNDTKIDLEFSEVHYNANYISEEEPKVEMSEKIIVTSSDISTDLTKLNVTLKTSDSELLDYFYLETSSDGYTVGINGSLPDRILNSQRSLIFTITAQLEDKESYATLVINLPTIIRNSTIQFNKILYDGNYKVSDGIVGFTTEPIDVTTEESDSKVHISISEDSLYKDFFNVSYSNKTVIVDNKETLPENVLQDVFVISLTMILSVDGSKDTSSAVLNIIINYDKPNDTDSISFISVLYSGTYEDVNENITISHEEIALITDQPDENIEVDLKSEYADHFNASYSSHQINITLISPIDSESLSDMTVIPIVLTARIRNTSHTASAVLNIRIISNISTGIISFPQLIHDGTYQVIDDVVDLNYSIIPLDTDQPEDNIEISILNEYSTYFSAVVADKQVNIKSIKLLSSDIVSNFTTILVELRARIKGTSQSASAVLNLRIIKNPDDDVGTISFADILYTGDYSTTDGKTTLDIESNINIITDRTDTEIKTNITDANGYSKYFKSTYESKLLKVEIADDLPEDIVNSNTFIALTLNAMITATNQVASATLIIRINNTQHNETGSISFPQLIHDGTYQVIDGDVDLNYTTISLDTDQPDDNLEITILNEYSTYFSAAVSDKQVTIKSIKLLSSDIVSNFTTILVELRAQIKGTSQSTSAVLNLRIIKNPDNDVGTISFADILYMGDYSTTHGKTTLDIKNNIYIITDRTENEIKTNITDDNGYSKYFKSTYESKLLKVEIADDLPEDIVNTNIFIALTLNAMITATNQVALATLIIRINNTQHNETGSISFPQMIHDGTYQVIDGDVSLNYSTISLDTDQPDDNIEITILNEYSTYFSAVVTDKQVNIKSIKLLSSDIVSNFTTILVELRAQIKGTSQSASAVLNLRIIKNPDDDVGTISFADILYTGDYSTTDGKTTLDIESNINIITDRIDTEIKTNITDANGYSKYFKSTYESKLLKVEIADDLPEDIVNSNTFIALTLNAMITATNQVASANLIIRINNTQHNETGSISFPQLIHDGTYLVIDGDVNLNYSTISLDTDQPDDNLEITILNEYSTYFSAAVSDKQVNIKSIKLLSSDIVSNFTTILVELRVQIKGTSQSASAVLNLRIIKNPDDDVGTISFADILYTGDYSTTDGKTTLDIESNINIITDRTDTEIKTNITDVNGYSQYFKSTYESKLLKVEIADDLPEDVVNSNTFIALTLNAMITATNQVASANLIIRINNTQHNETGSISFPKLIHDGTYQVIDGDVDLNYSTISLDTDQPDDNIEITILNEYSTYFSAAVSDKQVNIKSIKLLSSDIISNFTTILVELRARIKGTSQSASAVLNLRIIKNPDDDVGTISFADILYTGDYSTTDGKTTLDIESNINIITDRTDTEIKTNITDVNGYSQYFKSTYESKLLKVEIADDLPEDIVNSNTFIALTLNAMITATNQVASANLLIRINNTQHNETGSISFPKLIHDGTYQVIDGDVNLNYSTISLDTDQPDDNIEITILNEYSTYFSAAVSDKQVNIKSIKLLSSDIVSNFTTILIELRAQIKGTSQSASAVLNLRIIKNPDDDVGTISFADILYTGDYSTTDGKTTLDIESNINIITDRTDNEIITNITDVNGYSQYFKSTYESKLLKVEIADDLPEDIVNSNTFIALTLNAMITATNQVASANLLIRINNTQHNETGSISFPKLIHDGTYQVIDGDVNLNYSTISLDTDQPDDNIEITILNEYSTYFSAAVSDKQVNIKSIKLLSSDIVSNFTTILIELRAQIKGTSQSASAVLNLRIIKNPDDDVGTISFADILYTGDYSTTDGKTTLDIESNINIITDRTDNEIITNITDVNGYSKYFKSTYESKLLKVEIADDLPEDIVNSNTFIALTLNAMITATNQVASANLIIRINNTQHNETGSISFPKLIHDGTYQVINGEVDLNYSSISLDTDQPDDNLEITILNEYSTYFSAAVSDKQVNIKSIKLLSSDIVSNFTTILVELRARIKGTSQSASAVLNLRIIKNPDDDVGTISFADILYTGDYSTTDGKTTLDIESNINIITDRTDTEIKTNITDVNGYSQYFKSTYESKLLKVEIADDLPEDIVNSNTFIALTLNAMITATNQVASANLLIRINNTQHNETGSISFPKLIHDGTYQVIDSDVKLNYSAISLDTDQPDDNLEITILNEYSTYFSAAVSDKQVTIKSIKLLSSDIVSNFTTILVELRAQIKGTSQSTSAVLNLRIIKNPDDDVGTISFGDILYMGDYSTTDGKTTLDIENNINIITDRTENEIKTNITDDNGYSKYFKSTYESKLLKVEIADDLPENIVNSNTFIALTLNAMITATNQVASATLVIRINNTQHNETGLISFPQLIHDGTYQVIDGEVSLNYSTISLDTDQPDENIDIAVLNEYSTYFSASVSDKQVNIKSIKSLSSDIVSNFTTILVELRAQIKGTSQSASAVLYLRIIKNPDDDIGTISFADILHTGDYSTTGGKTTLDIEGNINIITDRTDNEIKTNITDVNGYSKYFNSSYVRKVLQVGIAEDLPEDILNSNTFIALNLNAMIIVTNQVASATLIIRINSTQHNETGSISFQQVIHKGTYQVIDGDGVLKYNSILLDTDQSDENIEVAVANEYSSYFSAIFSDKQVIVKSFKTLPSEIISKLTEILIELKAQIRGTSLSSIAVLDLKIISNNYNGTIAFAEILHEGEYSTVNNRGKLEIDDKIEIITDKTDSEIETSITSSSDYQKYFRSSYSQQLFSVELITDLPQNIVSDTYFIPLTLTAKITGTDQSSAGVLNVRIKHDNGGDDDNSKDSFNKIPYIVAICLLALVILALTTAAAAFYYFKLRRKDYTEVDEEVWKVKFDKTAIKKTPPKPGSKVQLRRPTGLTLNPALNDIDADAETSTDTPEIRERKKSVVFDDNVEKLQIESTTDDDVNERNGTENKNIGEAVA